MIELPGAVTDLTGEVIAVIRTGTELLAFWPLPRLPDRPYPQAQAVPSLSTA